MNETRKLQCKITVRRMSAVFYSVKGEDLCLKRGDLRTVGIFWSCRKTLIAKDFVGKPAF
jgi:hypothetical protein